MRARMFLPIFLFCVFFPVLAGEEKKKDALKVDLSYLEKTWGLKCKSHTITPPKPIMINVEAGKDKSGRVTNGGRVQAGISPAMVTFLIEFTKDVENLKELRAAFAPVYENRDAVRTIRTWPLWLYFFDEENVSVGKIPLSNDSNDPSRWRGDGQFHVSVSIAGEITGKKGDAIRVTIGIASDDFKKVRKINARPGEKERDKDKGKK